MKLSSDKNSLVRALSLGFMVIGIGFIVYAIFNIWSQSHYSLEFTSSGYYIHTNAEISKLQENRTVSVESNSLLVPTIDKTLYLEYPQDGDNIGSLTIPALNQKLPIIQGTGVKELSKGVGHFTQSVLPGEEDNCVISGHRDTVFRQIGKLKLGDKLIVQTSAGTFNYEVNGTRVVDKDDKTVIVPMDHAVLTMTTCYPFNFIGNAPDRYIVSATLVKGK